jgi:hypothetical protein
VFEGWDNYFVLMGTASGGLIGLLFVVVTLTAGFDRSKALRGQAIYMTPTMVHFAATLAISAIVLAPKLQPHLAAILIGGAILAGGGNAARTCLGIVGLHRNRNDPPHWSDFWCYGAAPIGVYLALAAAAAGLWNGAPRAVDALAALLLTLLLVAIRNAWDLITWIAPGPPPGSAAS